ncbi:Ig-like domain-containing protein [Thalassotalea euphylliae]|uniref:Ig-like domain-containing protein n=1 Tax=Thalassotalea euphylliae TaxID=1655234 RepID=UPI0015F2549E|nr:Ig-like domain-containing protein [Thalassotalea euphylliae]
MIDGLTNISIDEDSALNTTFYASDADGKTLTLRLKDGSPDWLTVTDVPSVVTKVAGRGSTLLDNIPADSARLINPLSIALDSRGNLYIADTGDHRIRRVNSAGTITTVAGEGKSGPKGFAGVAGFSGDGGQGTAANLSSPKGVAVDSAGNIYIADSDNHRIRKVDTLGIITTVAGTGVAGFSGDNGLATQAALNAPRSVAIGSDGDLYIASENSNRIRKVSLSTGIITTAAGNGSGGFRGDNGLATAARLFRPLDAVKNSKGELFIADWQNNRIRKVDTSGNITTFAGTGARGFSGDGALATAAQINRPRGLAVDRFDNIYIADAPNNRIRKVLNSSNIIETVYGGTGLLSSPSDAVIDNLGNLYIADNGHLRIIKITPRTFRLSGTPTNDDVGSQDVCVIVNDGVEDIEHCFTLTVNNTNDAPNANSQSVTTAEETAKAITLTGGDIDVGDTFTFSVVSQPDHGNLTGTPPNLIYTPDANFVGSDDFTFKTNDGTTDSSSATVTITVTNINDAPVANNQSVTTAEDIAKAITLTGSDVDVGDSFTYSVVSQPDHGSLTGTAPNLTYTPDGNYVGSDSFTFKTNDGSVDSGLATVTITVTNTNDAPIIFPVSDANAIEDQGFNLTVNSSDAEGDALTLRLKDSLPAWLTVSNVPAAIRTIVGGSQTGLGDGSAANLTQLNAPEGLAYDGSNFLYIADTANHLVYKLALNTGAISVVAGGGSSGLGDGSQAAQAELNRPAGLAFDSLGNLYIADSGHHRIRKLDISSNIITTVAGSGVKGFNGDNQQATLAALNLPLDIAFDDDDNLYIADQVNHRIRKVASDGSISTFAGNGSSGFSGDSSIATSAQLHFPTGITIDTVGNLYIADNINNRIRKVTRRDGKINTVAGGGNGGDGGSATAAKLVTPFDVILDRWGNLYISGDDNRIRKVDVHTNIITTVVGNGSFGNGGDNGSPASAQLRLPTSLAFDNRGNLYIAELSGNRIRQVTQDHFALSGSPTNAEVGSDNVCVIVNDGAQDTEQCFTLTVSNTNDAPIADSQSVTTAEDTAKAITLTASDIDVGDTFTFSVVNQPDHGQLTGTAPNLTYTPDANYVGNDSFTFKTNDGSADSALATVTITVTNTNDAPIATNQSIVTTEDTAKAITLTANDIDVGESLTFTLVSQPSNGKLAGTAPNLIYTPAVDFVGSDIFTFIANDGEANSQAGSIIIRVTNINDAPIANAQNVTVTEDIAKVITLTGSDIDVGDSLSFTVVGQPSHGQLSGSGANLTYRPDANYHGSDNFTFKANDGSADSGLATVTITVTNTNDAPLANNQVVSTAEETTKVITLTGSDIDNDGLNFSIVSQPAHGLLTGTAPNITYTPSLNYVGNDSFTFKTNDGTADSGLATVAITVTNTNDAPIANDLSVSTAEDTAQVITLTGSDIDVGDSLVYSLVSQPSHGQLTGSAPNYTYTPNANYYGRDSFTFKANDGSADSGVATVTITITSVNDAPIANTQSVTTAEDTSQGITLTGSDIDNDGLNFSIVKQPTHGVLSGTLPNLTYRPNTNYVGSDSFYFKTNDSKTDSVVARVAITVTNINDVPVANDQSVTTAEENPKAITLTGSDIDNDSLSFSLVSQPTHGKLSGSAPNLTYTPDTHYAGRDSFTFKANDGTADSALATITVTVTNNNDAPTASDQSVTTVEDTAKVITLVANDVDVGDSLNFSVVRQPAHGQLSGSAPNLTYTPEENYYGSDSFTFKANDSSADSELATVTITITSANDVPTANAQSVSTSEDTAKAIILTGNDIDEGSSLTFTVVEQPSNGQLTGTAPSLTYTPKANYHGSDSFTFKANDGNADSELARVSITVSNTNDAPVANDQSVSVAEDSSQAISLTASDIDDASSLTFTVISQPSHGQLTGVAPNLTYTPEVNYHGSDSFTFKANDSLADSDLATVTITVDNANDVPVANDQSVSTAEDVAKVLTLTASDIDIGDSLSFRVIDQPSYGQLSGTAPNLTYTPDSHYNGSDSFTFKANDGTTDSALATVNISVSEINDAPIVNAIGNNSAREDSAYSVAIYASDPESDRLNLRLKDANPSWLTVSNKSSVISTVAGGNQTGLGDSSAANLTQLNAPQGLAYDGANQLYIADTDNHLIRKLDLVSGAISIVAGGGTSLGDGSQANQAQLNQPVGLAFDSLGDLYIADSGHHRIRKLDISEGIITTVAGNGGAGYDSDDQQATLAMLNAPLAIAFDSDDNLYIADQSNHRVRKVTSDGKIQTVAGIGTPGFSGDGLAARLAALNSPAGLTIDTAGALYIADKVNGRIRKVSSDGKISTIAGGGSGGEGSQAITAQLVAPSDITFDRWGNLYLSVDGHRILKIDANTQKLTTIVGDGSSGNSGDDGQPSLAQLSSPTSLMFDNDGNLFIAELSGDRVRKVQPDYFVLSGQPSNADVGDANVCVIANDGQIDSAEQCFRLTVTNTNDIPVANDQSITTAHNTAKAVTLTGSDIDTGEILTFAVLSQPSNGQLSGTAPNLTYTPNANFFGADSFTFTVNDGDIDSATATVSISVAPASPTPGGSSSGSGSSSGGGNSGSGDSNGGDNSGSGDSNGGDNSGSGDSNGGDNSGSGDSNGGDNSGSGDSSGGDNSGSGDSNGGDNSGSGDSNGGDNSGSGDSNGGDNSGSGDSNGGDNSGSGDSNGVANSAPVAVNDSASIAAGETLILNVLANDTDPENDRLTLVSVAAKLGQADITDNQLRFIASDQLSGVVTVDYVIQDQAGNTAQGQVTISINNNSGIVLTVPDDLCGVSSVNATGLFTRVTLGVARATDAQGNNLPVALVDNLEPVFAPGKHAVLWQTQDASGNRKVAQQVVCIEPLVNLGQDIDVGEGSEISLPVVLNGESPSYPVTIDYAVSGSADNQDHNLVSGQLVISQGTRTNINLVIANDDQEEGDETLVITLTNGINLGDNIEQVVTITEQSVAPMVELTILQNGKRTSMITPNGGEITVQATVSNADNNDNLNFQWTSSSAELVNTSASPTTFSLDPSALAQGMYSLQLTVTVDGHPELTTSVIVFFQVVDELATLTDRDSDGDGIADNIEGYIDTDGDGIADYLDAIAGCQVQQQQTLDDKFLMETETGICLRQEQFAQQMQATGLLMNMSDLNGLLPNDDDFINVGGLFGFVATGLTQVGGNIIVTIPQRKPIPENAVYRKYNKEQGWYDFVEDANNKLLSAAGEPGYCPPPERSNKSQVWTPGLTPGHWCVKIQLEDGGANDSDNTTDHTIIDPGYVSTIKTGNSAPVAHDDHIDLVMNQAITIDALANDLDEDNDPLTIVTAYADFGVVEVDNNQLHYTPMTDHLGTTTLDYVITDGKGGSSQGKVHLRIMPNTPPVNTPPVITNEQSVISQGQSVEVNLLANDTDAEQDTLRLIAVEHANVSFSANGDATFKPNAEFFGNVSIAYTVEDSAGNRAVGQWQVTVTQREQQVNNSKKSGGGSITYTSLFVLLLMLLARFTLVRKKSNG